MAVSDPAPVLDRRVLRRSVAVTLVVAVPPAVIVRILKGGDLAGRDSNLWGVAVALVLLAFLVGGYTAGRGSPELPLAHGAGTAAFAYVTMAAASAVAALAIGNHITGAVVLAVVMLGAVCISAGVIGSYGAVWWAGRGAGRSAGRGTGPNQERP
jgi:hypothetical protein